MKNKMFIYNIIKDMDDGITKTIRQYMQDDGVDIKAQQDVITLINATINTANLYTNITKQITLLFQDGNINVYDVPMLINLVIRVMQSVSKIKINSNTLDDMKYVIIYIIIDLNIQNNYLKNISQDDLVNMFSSLWQLVELQFETVKCCC